MHYTSLYDDAGMPDRALQRPLSNLLMAIPMPGSRGRAPSLSLSRARALSLSLSMRAHAQEYHEQRRSRPAMAPPVLRAALPQGCTLPWADCGALRVCLLATINERGYARAPARVENEGEFAVGRPRESYSDGDWYPRAAYWPFRSATAATAHAAAGAPRTRILFLSRAGARTRHLCAAMHRSPMPRHTSTRASPRLPHRTNTARHPKPRH